jgi:phosphoribosyl 1,2-cyclic phosphodiesterase/DNA-binding response OmpR family regulator
LGNWFIVKTVLIIDDDRALQGALVAPLKEAGWTVLEAGGGEQGITLALQHMPDVVICDLLMPRCNGYQVCRSIRQQTGILENTKIIVTSGSIYNTDRTNALDAGANEYLIKPVKAAVVLQLLETLLQQGANAAKGGSSPTGVLPPPMPVADLTTYPAKVKFWGVRGSVPTPGETTVKYGGNTSCVEVRADGEIIILDAGTGIRSLGKQLVGEFKGKAMNLTLLISHTHWDHIQGFPFFIPAYNPQNKLRIIGYEGARSGLQGILSSQMESPYFPISMQQMPGHLEVEELKDFHFNIGSISIQAAFLNHPGICVGYRIQTSGGSVAYLPDNEPFSRLRTLPSLVQVDKSYESVSYAQHQDQKLIEFIQDVDVLIMDSQYDDAEYHSHVGWGHGCVDDVVSLAMIARVKKLFLFHHDPEHDDEHITRMVQWARELVTIHGETLEVDAAREGLEVPLVVSQAASAEQKIEWLSGPQG